MPQHFDLKAPRKPANLTINADLLQRARLQKINLSATLEKALVEELRRRQQERWIGDNREAIAAYNAEVPEFEVFSGAIRALMAQFHVYRNPHPDSESRFPLLLDVQSDLIGALDTPGHHSVGGFDQKLAGDDCPDANA